jgi:hypothetical protein
MVIFLTYANLLKNKQGVEKKNNNYAHSSRQNKAAEIERFIIVFRGVDDIMDIRYALGGVPCKPAYRLCKNKGRQKDYADEAAIFCKPA